jgi:hypothetical protein
VLVHDNGRVLTSSVWGPRKGEEIIFNSTEEVLQLVTKNKVYKYYRDVVVEYYFLVI